MKADLEYRLSDPATMEANALSLMSQGVFTNTSTGSTAAVYAPFLERAGDLVSDFFAEEESKVKVDLSYVQAERNPYVETSSMFGLSVSSQINDRITVNGQVGVPVGGVNQSAVAGNVEVQVRLNDANTFKGRMFNRENDVNFLGEGINYTQGIGLTYELDFDTIGELFRQLFNKKEDDENPETSTGDDADSEFTPEYIKFMESRNKKKTNAEEKKPEPIPETE
jgi:hypothetical protein